MRRRRRGGISSERRRKNKNESGGERARRQRHDDAACVARAGEQKSLYYILVIKSVEKAKNLRPRRPVYLFLSFFLSSLSFTGFPKPHTTTTTTSPYLSACCSPRALNRETCVQSSLYTLRRLVVVVHPRHVRISPSPPHACIHIDIEIHATSHSLGRSIIAY